MEFFKASQPRLKNQLELLKNGPKFIETLNKQFGLSKFLTEVNFSFSKIIQSWIKASFLVVLIRQET